MQFIFILLIAFDSLSAALVPNAFPDFVSSLPNYTSPAFPTLYSGFAPLDSQNDSALFYYYFPSSNPSSDTPTLLWLNGGPASSGTWSIFIESGPFRFQNNKDGGYSVYSIDEKNKLQSWTAFYNVLYLDQPVGTGYSYTRTNKYPKTEDEIANDVWKALQYFIKVHPETVNTKWYFSGESYAGKFVPAVTYWTVNYNNQIRQNQLEGTIVNLQGMIVGSGFILPVSQRITSIEASHAANLLTPNQYQQIKTIAAECQQLFAKGSTLDANAKCDSILSYYDSVAGIGAGAINLPNTAMSNLGDPQNPYFNNKAVFQALHAEGSKKQGTLYNASSPIAIQNLQGDRLNTSIVYIDYLLTKMPCLFFAGNFDAQDGSYGTYDWFKYLTRSYADVLQTTRNIWYVNKTSVGMFTQYQNLTYVIIGFAGHIVPYFQLNVTVKMIEIFTQRKNNWNYYSGLTPTPMDKIMCKYSNNCNGNGQCNPQGLCACKVGYGLADCSAQAVAFDPFLTYTINQRGFLFFKVPLNGKDKILQIESQGNLAIFYSPFTTGPVADQQEAEASLLPSKSAPRVRTFYLNSYGRDVGYLTIQNTEYFSSTNLTIKSPPKESLGTLALSTSIRNMDFNLGENISLIIYFTSFILGIMAILILSQIKRRKNPINGDKELESGVLEPLSEKI